MNKNAKRNPMMMILIIAIIGIGAYLYFTPGTQIYGPFATVDSMNYDTCLPYTLTNQTNLAANYLDGPLGAGDCACGSFTCTENVTCTDNGAGADCQGNGPKAGLSSQQIARISIDTPNGTSGKTLELLGRAANACKANNIIVEPGKTYTLSFWFKHVQGGLQTDWVNGYYFASPVYCIWRTGTDGVLSNDCEPSKHFIMAGEDKNTMFDNQWHYYQEPFTVPTGTTGMGLFFYANGINGDNLANSGVTINRYSDIRVVEGDVGCKTTPDTVVETPTSKNSIITFLTKEITNINGFSITYWMAGLLVLVVLFFVIKKK